MKIFLFSLLFFSFPLFAQNLDIKTLKTMMIERKEVLETINQGMSKKLTTVYKIPTDLGFCEMTETAIQTVLKIEDSKIIVHSKENYVPANLPACEGAQIQEVSVIFYQDRPSLEADLNDIDAMASNISTISRTGAIVTMKFNSEAGELVTAKYDLSKPSFKNTLLVQDSKTSVVTMDLQDIDVSTIDLKKVLFCESAESNDCVEGDWSDILF